MAIDALVDGGEAETLQRLGTVQRNLLIVTVISTLCVLIGAALQRLPILAVLFGAGCAFLTLILLSRRELRSGRAARAVRMLCGGLLGVSVAMATLGPALRVPVQLVVIIGSSLAVSFLRGGSLRVMLGCAFATSIIDSLIGIYVPQSLELPGWAWQGLSLLLTTAGVGIALILKNEYSSRLNRSLSQAEAQRRLIETARADLSAQHERLATTLSAVNEGVITVDPKGRVDYLNAAAAQLINIKGNDTGVGTPLFLMFRPIDPKTRSLLTDTLESSIREGAQLTLPEDALLQTKDGGDRRITIHVSPLGPEGAHGSVITIADVTKIRELDEMRVAKEAAEAAALAKARFLASMSHEIRTPMNAVIGMTSLLVDSNLSGKQREFVDIIRSSAEHLLTLINDILDFSKIEAGKIEIESHPFRLQECVDSSLDLVAAKADDKGLELVYVVEPEVPSAFYGDLGRLRQVLVNLLSNAVKFTTVGEVTLTISSRVIAPRKNELHFAVRDTGSGIPADKLGMLFQAFSQIDNSTTRKTGGTGLGLAISKHLVELMEGKLWVESTLGKGSTFHFTAVLEEAFLSERVLQNGRLGFTGTRVLVVDDNETNRKLLQHLLHSWEAEPVLIATPAEALELIRRGEQFQVGILDYHMPGMDGLTLATEIRKLRSETELPLVLLGSWLTPETNGHSFFARLLKPLKPAQLFDVLVELFEERAATSRAAPPVATGPVAPTSTQSPARRRSSQDLPIVAGGSRLRILVAEDNPINQRVAAALLEQLGCTADFAGNGQEALRAVRRQSYDVVFMDVQMPEMDGLEATREICRRYPKGERPRIIGLTAHALIEYQRQCLQAGMDDYVTKPVTVHKLADALSRCRVRIDAPRIPKRTSEEISSGEVGALSDASLDNIREAGGDDLVREILNMFLKMAPDLIAEARRGLAERRFEDAYRAIHSLKSSAAYAGAERLARLCEAAETALRAASHAEADKYLAQLDASWVKARPRIERALRSLSHPGL